MYFIMTSDVEHHSITLNREDKSVPKQIYNTGLPRLLDLLSKYDVPSTFYFTGMFAEDSPESIELVAQNGHEIGCHAYDHSPSRGFDLLSYDEQVNELKKAKKAFGNVGEKVTSFRAPALRINKQTVRALEEMNFKTDSSIASQRFDGPMSFGSKQKLKWLSAPRKPYYLSYESPTKTGNSKILEIPLSALVLPYIGTTMRINPTTTAVLEKFIFKESKKTDKPVVFLFHPNECMDYDLKFQINRRSSNLIEFIFADVIRHRLKMKNLGKPSLHYLEQIFKNATKEGFEFITIEEYRKIYNKEKIDILDTMPLEF